MIIKYGLIGCIILCSISCSRIKNKSQRLVNKSKTNAKHMIAKQMDKVFPPFDHDKPDTDNNKKRFKDFLKIEITPDVSEIYCFDDVVGIDADYMFAFKCDSTTSEKIILTHNLKKDSIEEDYGFGLQHDFDWWDKKRISQLDKYSWTNGEGYHKFYWYDQENGKAYFFDFDLY